MVIALMARRPSRGCGVGGQQINVVADEFHQVPQRTLFDHEVAIDISFPEIQVGVGGDLQSGCRGFDADPDVEERRVVPLIELPRHDRAERRDDREAAVANDTIQQGFEHDQLWEGQPPG